MIRSALFSISILITLSGCGVLLGSTQGSSNSSSDASSNSGLGASPQTNPRRQPAVIADHQPYPFNNAIPVFRPGDGDLVTSGFGWRRLNGQADFHCAIDVTARIGTPVYAVGSGKITFKRTSGSQGGLVVYNGGHQFTYWHITPSSRLKEGQSVRAGQQIGVVANWGSRSHLHYGVYYTGGNTSPNAREETNCVNPLQFSRGGVY